MAYPNYSAGYKGTEQGLAKNPINLHLTEVKCWKAIATSNQIKIKLNSQNPADDGIATTTTGRVFYIKNRQLLKLQIFNY